MSTPTATISADAAAARAEIDRLDAEYLELRRVGNVDAAWLKRREYLTAQRKLWDLTHPPTGEWARICRITGHEVGR